MTKEEIALALKNLSYNVGVLERTEIGMGNYKHVMEGYQKVLRDLTNIIKGVFELNHGESNG